MHVQRILGYKRAHAGPELELPAYGCEDHFQELDTVEHSWECVAQLLRGGHTTDILCDVGMPVIHRGLVVLVGGKQSDLHNSESLPVAQPPGCRRCPVQLPDLPAERQGPPDPS